MPIIYVHGVSVRDDREWDDLHLLLRKYVAPKIAADPQNVWIKRCYWGDYGAKFRWSGASAPSSPTRIKLQELLDKGADKIRSVKESAKAIDVTPKRKTEPLLRTRDLINKLRNVRLQDMTGDNLSDLCAELLSTDSDVEHSSSALTAIAADETAEDARTRTLLTDCKTLEDELKLMQQLVRAKYAAVAEQWKDPISRQDLPGIGQKIGLSIEESLARGAHSAGFAFTRAAVEIRSPMNRFVTLFLGDVLTYIHERGNYKAPGWIPSAFLAALTEARENQLEREEEPLIVMSHSMGGQIVYDAITHFLPRLQEYSGIRIDFWAATASQIGLFEELKLFLESSDEYTIETGIPAPFPDESILGYWWNVWDHNDFISYSCNGIVAGVDDEPYNTGMFMVDAHGGYLVMPSFFRRFGRKLESAKAQNWRRPKQEVL
jgi:hypothetical protein